MEESKCYLCGGTEFVDTGYKLRDSDEIKVLRCKNCSLFFLSSFEHITSGFYEQGKMHSVDFEPKKWLEASFSDDKRRFESLKKELRNKKVLDFGCGAGGFLLFSKEIAETAKGLEKQESLSSFFKEKGLNVFKSLDEINEKFDLITMFHVLEHLPDPISVIKSLALLLNENGELIIEVPNSDDALLSLYKSKEFADFTHWSCHLFSFNRYTLSKIAEKAGMKINYVKHIQRYGLANHLGWILNKQKGGHAKWPLLEKSLLSWIYKSVLIATGRSDTLVISISI